MTDYTTPRGVGSLVQADVRSRKSHILLAATELFAATHGPTKVERHVYAELFRQYIGETPIPERRQISTLLSRCDAAPHECVLTLARDEDASVAHRILAYSSVLTERDLIAAVGRGPRAVRRAIALRHAVSHEVRAALRLHASDDAANCPASEDGASDTPVLGNWIEKVEPLPGALADEAAPLGGSQQPASSEGHDRQAAARRITQDPSPDPRMEREEGAESKLPHAASTCLEDIDPLEALRALIQRKTVAAEIPLAETLQDADTGSGEMVERQPGHAPSTSNGDGDGNGGSAPATRDSHPASVAGSAQGVHSGEEYRPAEEYRSAEVEPMGCDGESEHPREDMADGGLAEIFLAQHPDERAMAIATAQAQVLAQIAASGLRTRAKVDPTLVRCLEQAAMARDGETLRRLFVDTLNLPQALIERMVADPHGEPLVVLCAALGLPTSRTVSLMLQMSPAAYSLDRLRDLSMLRSNLDPRVARHLVSQWAAHSAAPDGATRSSSARHAPHLQDAVRARRDTIVGTQSEVVRKENTLDASGVLVLRNAV